MRVTVFGYLCRDRNVLPSGETSEIVGGKGLFATAALSQSGVTTDLITWLPTSDLVLLAALTPYAVAPQVIPIPTGTVNTNTHRGAVTVATTKLDPKSVTVGDLTAEMRQAITGSDVILLMPDIEGKISLELIKYLSDTLGLTLAVDIGKYFRQHNPDGTLQPRYPWPGQAELLRFTRTVFLSAEDIQPALQTGESILSLARDMAEQGPAEVIVTEGDRGAQIFSRETNELIHVPAFVPPALVDPTGAGDTFIGAFVAERLATDDLHAAGRYASMAASMKLAHPGPLQATRAEIEARLREQLEIQ